MFQNLRIRIIHYFINRELKRNGRDKLATSLSRAKTVGVLFSTENEKYNELISKFIDDLSSTRKFVHALGFVPATHVPGIFFSTMKIDIITPKDFNFFGVPVSAVIKQFISKKFDILIDLTLIGHLPIEYIACVSHAGFKAGRYREVMVKHYDFLVTKNEDMDESEYLKYFLDYLTKINNSVL
jgi:hypothetical protein